MNEINIDINDGYPKDVGQFINDSFDYVITVCDNAKETCPVFSGNVKHNLHIGFEDPADAVGTEDEIFSVFRKVREEIKVKVRLFYQNELRE